MTLFNVFFSLLFSLLFSLFTLKLVCGMGVEILYPLCKLTRLTPPPYAVYVLLCLIKPLYTLVLALVLYMFVAVVWLCCCCVSVWLSGCVSGGVCRRGRTSGYLKHILLVLFSYLHYALYYVILSYLDLEPFYSITSFNPLISNMWLF